MDQPRPIVDQELGRSRIAAKVQGEQARPMGKTPLLGRIVGQGEQIERPPRGELQSRGEADRSAAIDRKAIQQAADQPFRGDRSPQGKADVGQGRLYEHGQRSGPTSAANLEAS